MSIMYADPHLSNLIYGGRIKCRSNCPSVANTRYIAYVWQGVQLWAPHDLFSVIIGSNLLVFPPRSMPISVDNFC